MKKIVYWLFMLPLFALLNGCDDTAVSYTHLTLPTKA